MKKYFSFTTNEDYAQNWVVEAETEEAAISIIYEGKGHKVGELRLIESCVDAFCNEEIDEEEYAEHMGAK